MDKTEIFKDQNAYHGVRFEALEHGAVIMTATALDPLDAGHAVLGRVIHIFSVDEMRGLMHAYVQSQEAKQ